MKTICLVVGHDRSTMGAINYLSEYEYEFNRRIALKVKHKLVRIKQDNIKLVVCTKVNGKPYFLEQGDIFFLVELHFNSFNGVVHGAESLVQADSPLKNMFVGPIKMFHETLVVLLGVKDRGIKRITRGERGYANLEQYKHQPFKVDNSMIWEPCFGSDTYGNRKIFEAEDLYVDKLVRVLMMIGNL